MKDDAKIKRKNKKDLKIFLKANKKSLKTAKKFSKIFK